MKHVKVCMPHLAYIAAFIIGVILFVVFWKAVFGSTSGLAVLFGMIGAATAVTLFWFRNKDQLHKKGKE